VEDGLPPELVAEGVPDEELKPSWPNLKLMTSEAFENWEAGDAAASPTCLFPMSYTEVHDLRKVSPNYGRGQMGTMSRRSRGGPRHVTYDSHGRRLPVAQPVTTDEGQDACDVALLDAG
jgi:hypothetical protein